MKKRTTLQGVFPVLNSAVLATLFFMSLVFLDQLMEKALFPGLRMFLSHLLLVVVILAVMSFLRGGLGKWGVNFKNWKKSLQAGLFLGLIVGILFSLFSYGLNLLHWSLARCLAQLQEKENLFQFFSQLLLVGTSEELFFRGLLVTYLMRKYSRAFLGLHVGVLIVSGVFASVQFYKLFFGIAFGNIWPLVIGAFIYGLLLGGLYQKTESLLGPILMHNLANCFVLIAGLGIS